MKPAWRLLNLEHFASRSASPVRRPSCNPNAVSRRSAQESPILAVTNNTHSTLARRAHGVIHCAAGPEIGVAATKTFVCQIIAGVAVALSALVATGRLSSARAVELADGLRRLPEQLAAAGTIANV